MSATPPPLSTRPTSQGGLGSQTPSTYPQSHQLPPDHRLLASHALLAAALHLSLEEAGLGCLGLCLQLSHHWLFSQLAREKKVSEDLWSRKPSRAAGEVKSLAKETAPT